MFILRSRAGLIRHPRSISPYMFLLQLIAIGLYGTIFHLGTFIDNFSFLASHMFLYVQDWSPPGLFLCFLCFFVYQFCIARPWVLIERKRQQVIQSSLANRSSFCATPLPGLPIVIQYKHTKGFLVQLWVWCLLALCGIAIDITIVAIFPAKPQSVPVTLLDLLTQFTIIYLCCAIPATAIFFLRSWKQCTINEYGIMKKRNKGILWHEASLFAFYKVRHWWRQEECYLEIASSTQTVYWQCIQQEPGWRNIWKPLISLEEHQKQIQTLIEYISTRTGLPLYDLSGPEPMQIYPPLTRAE